MNEFLFFLDTFYGAIYKFLERNNLALQKQGYLNNTKPSHWNGCVRLYAGTNGSFNISV